MVMQCASTTRQLMVLVSVQSQRTCSNTSNDGGSLVVAVGALSAALAALLICYLSTLFYCLRANRRVSRKEKRWREAERQRLMADRDSVGTAGSVSRASAVGLVRGVGGRGEVLQNPLYTEEDDDEEEGEGREGDGVEMLAMLSDMQALPPPSPTHSSDL
ncbi:hypothetical protein GBAR_LOCUS29256 [Geodia barretti]|uniref:Uncharacterized protein n=1 Tax=Geodia barretti TaxID=519541 RepID=A0AA35XIE1_GEOBA|nr:hypothetical protein GBAR_LOCUS29256 [Geodia barretti]